MKVFEITTTESDYPFLVLAEGFMEAVGILQREKNVWDGDIITVRKLDYNGDHILVKELILAKERLEEKVRRELEPKLPHWQKMPNGAAGGGDRQRFFVRSSKGYYFTSATIGGTDGYYLDMDDLEQLPGLPYKEV
ncbi:MAG: hypothetical protein IJV24_07335 [Prevotella sp.]|nr:hypothetical protein [Prevotella sp.]